MNYLKEFIISFSGLSLGNHDFEFDIDEKFFACFEDSEVRVGQVKVLITMEKQERMLVFDFSINGHVEVMCDRCSGEFNQPINGNEVLIFKFGDAYFEESEDVVVIPRGEHQVDVSTFIYEFINLLLPYQRVHPDDKEGNPGCDAEVLKKLEELSPKGHHDNRWDALEGLQFDTTD
jgi:uncharacterized metal-binding protein YceD (DUF177 family)